MEKRYSRPSHGSFSLSVEDHVVTLDCTGPWNKELVEEIQIGIRPIAQEMKHEPWCVLVIARGQAIHIPESRLLAVETTKKTKAEGRVATAVVVKENQFKNVIKQLLDEQYNLAGEPHRFFEDEELAKSWLVEQLNHQA